MVRLVRPGDAHGEPQPVGQPPWQTGRSREAHRGLVQPDPVQPGDAPGFTPVGHDLQFRRARQSAWVQCGSAAQAGRQPETGFGCDGGPSERRESSRV
ncbi:hypothetical protein [Streptomyces neyagawaensis]|uniref:hypothetical protein n=1 Tax=Streptomyces neyagawaensis TaxID=42238 RepID=UPI0006E1DD6C|nr:hypothetical protein [Streptomyces neyagawaensis]MCL6734773.1 hypothetical protein [Streptomyces neyagawaensis]MDE1686561.1 hypothetical protein [Streptomyces neyagawaensis]